MFHFFVHKTTDFSRVINTKVVKDSARYLTMGSIEEIWKERVEGKSDRESRCKTQGRSFFDHRFFPALETPKVKILIGKY